MFTWLRQIHRFCLQQALYPVWLSTLLAGGLFVGRVYLSGHWTFFFLVWNLFLAWIPFLLSLGMVLIYRRRPRRWGYLLGLGLIWLIFFPNAPYIVTDLLHLQMRPPVPIWYDTGLLAAFAWAGLFLAVFSLRAMQMLVKAAAGVLAGWVFVLGVVGLTGLGIYLGRFLGWNSWDLFLRPQAVLADIILRVTHPLHNLATFGVTALFALFLLVCYLTVTASPSRDSYASSDL